MKKIAVYVSVHPEGGGSFQYAETLLQALAGLRDACPVEIRCWFDIDHKNSNEHWLPRLQALNLSGERVRRPRGLFTRLRTSIRKRRITFRHGRNSLFMQACSSENVQIAAWKPDLIFSPQAAFFIMPDATPQIAPIHDLMHLFEPTFPEVGTEKEIASRNRRYMGMSRYCTAILVDSHLGKEHVLQHYPAQPEQIHVVPYAAPPQLLTCRPERPDGDFPGHFIFYPAQFWHHKNHIRLLNAIHAARTTCPDIHCIFSGSTIHQGYPHFAEEVKKLKIQQAVTVLGYVSTPEMAWLYRNARGLVMPTLFGPTNIPPLEAMATGCPAAVSDIYAMREQCKDAVLYFDPKDESSMASAITALWLDKDLRMRLKEKGLAHHRQWTAQDMQKTFASIVKEQLQI